MGSNWFVANVFFVTLFKNKHANVFFLHRWWPCAFSLSDTFWKMFYSYEHYSCCLLWKQVCAPGMLIWTCLTWIKSCSCLKPGTLLSFLHRSKVSLSSLYFLNNLIQQDIFCGIYKVFVWHVSTGISWVIAIPGIALEVAHRPVAPVCTEAVWLRLKHAERIISKGFVWCRDYFITYRVYTCCCLGCTCAQVSGELCMNFMNNAITIRTELVFVCN